MDRNNCGCAPYNPISNRTDYLKELYDTCDCVLPCKSCECVDETGTCPPPPPCKPAQLLKCCVEKPKKGLWQLLFGSKKCSPSLKKKLDKKRKQVTKMKCAPLSNLNSKLSKDSNECQQQATNSNSCPRKGCFPTPKSICGCHFYFNIENRTRRHTMTVETNDQQIYENNETPFEYGYDINEEPERDNLATSRERHFNPKGNKITNQTQNMSSSPNNKAGELHKNTPQRYTNHKKRFNGNEGRKKSSVHLTHNKRYSADEGRKPPSAAFNPFDIPNRRSTGTSYNNNGQRKSSLCNRKRQSSCSSLPEQTENPSKNDVHIGLTFTKETRYFLPNNDACLPLHPEQNSSGDCKNSQIASSNENSEQVLTVEIHKSGVNVSKNEDANNHDSAIDDHTKRKKLPKSESLTRELLPLMIKKGRVSGQRALRLSMSEDESEDNIDNTQLQYNKNRQSLRSQGNSKANLDRRVSEILKKLNEIENKINIIEKKEQDNKKIQVDFDGAKSTVSLHITDPTPKKCENGYDYNTNLKRGSGNTVIEIRRSQSKCSSHVRKPLPDNEICSSQSLNACDKKQPSSQKIVIKLPKFGAKTQCFVLPDKQNKVDENCKQTNMWNDVSDQLKCSPPTEKCYCYECVQKRLKCL